MLWVQSSGVNQSLLFILWLLYQSVWHIFVRHRVPLLTNEWTTMSLWVNVISQYVGRCKAIIDISIWLWADGPEHVLHTNLN